MSVPASEDFKRMERIRNVVRHREVGQLTLDELQSIQRMFGPPENVSLRDISTVEEAIRRLRWD